MRIAGLMLVCVVAIGAQTGGAQRIELIITGGHDTDPRDRGRPDILIAAALGVPTEVFREAFRQVTPAPGGQEPDPEQVRSNKEALLGALRPYGVTNDRLDTVSNYYRYNRGRGEQLWRNTPATAYATVSGGLVTGFTITNPGSGYSSEPRVSIPGMPDVKVNVKLLFTTDLARNGSIQEVNAAAPHARNSFEVASIKLHPGIVTVSSDPSISGTRVSATAVTLLDLIATAYSARYDQISGGPRWIGSEHYDLAARAEGENPIAKPELRQMLQTLLAERFGLKCHHEARQVDSYWLVVDNKRPKLKESTPGETGRSFVKGGTAGMHMEAAGGTMEQLAAQLSNTAGRPVFDKTGLAGSYSFQLDWMPAAPDSRPPESEFPDIFTAVREQLGLRLEPAKTAVQILVIDRALPLR